MGRHFFRECADEEVTINGSEDRLCTQAGGAGTPIEEVCRKLGISQQTFYRWKKKFDGLGTEELRRLKQLEEENKRFKSLVTALSLDNQILQDVLSK